MESILVGGVSAFDRTVGLSLFDVPTHSFDIAVSATFTIMALWRKDKGTSKILLIHDTSSAMSREKIIWDVLVDVKLTSQLLGYDTRTLQLPVAVQETISGDSRDWSGLQLADILAGAMSETARHLLNEQLPLREYKAEVTEIINSGEFFIHSIWPSENVTPETLGTVGQNEGPLVDEITSILKKNCTRM